MKNLKYFIIVFFAFNFTNSFSQGCSDAGFCSINKSLEDHDTAKKSSIEFGTVYAGAEQDVTVFSQYVTYSRDINANFSVSFKVTAATAKGSFGTRGNIGDTFIIGNYKLKSKSEVRKTALLFGIKAPFTSANNKINGYSIPMVYQSSLGTFDLLGGINVNYKKWDFNAAFQIPVVNINKNSYESSFSGTTLFPSTNLFRRKSDGLLRATYTIKTNDEKFTFKPNILLIYHFGQDSFENVFGKRENIIGSDGATLNGNLIANYKLNKNSSLETSLAAPFVIRDVKPDGLTRKYTIGLAYKLSF